MIGVGERAQARKGRRSHEDQSFAGVEAGNQRRPNQKATLTSRMRTGTSTSGPITAAKATGEARPKAAMATAIASSKLLPAAVKATRSEEHTSELQSLMRNSYAVFCLQQTQKIPTSTLSIEILYIKNHH